MNVKILHSQRRILVSVYAKQVCAMPALLYSLKLTGNADTLGISVHSEKASELIHAVSTVVQMQAHVCVLRTRFLSEHYANIAFHFDEREHAYGEWYLISFWVLNSFGTLILTSDRF